MPETTPRVLYCTSENGTFIVAAFLASAALNDSKLTLRSKLPITMLGRNRGKTSLVPRPFCYAHAREGKEGSGK